MNSHQQVVEPEPLTSLKIYTPMQLTEEQIKNKIHEENLFNGNDYFFDGGKKSSHSPK